jgi:methionyl-tRNA synthetase
VQLIAPQACENRNEVLGQRRAYCEQCNELIEKSAPWKLAKDPAQVHRLSTLLYCLAEAIRIIAILIPSVLPKAATQICEQVKGTSSSTSALEAESRTSSC